MRRQCQREANMSEKFNDAEATRNFEIRNILTAHCGERLTPDKVDEIIRQIEVSMKEGPCAWAFCAELDR